MYRNLAVTLIWLLLTIVLPKQILKPSDLLFIPPYGSMEVLSLLFVCLFVCLFLCLLVGTVTDFSAAEKIAA